MNNEAKDSNVLDAETLAFLAELDREMADTEEGRASLKRRQDHERMLAYKEQKRRETLPDTELASDDFIIREMIRANKDGLPDKAMRFEKLNRELGDANFVSDFAKREMIERGYVHGLFTVDGNTIHVVDPCYVKRDDMMGVVETVRNGRYVARSLYEAFSDNTTGWIVRGIELVHVDFDGKDLDYVHSDVTVDVESGMVGLFTSSAIVTSRMTEGFYEMCCKECRQPIDGVKVGGSLVSSTLGDGTYHVSIAKIDDETVSVRVLFSDYVEEFA